MRPTLYLMLGYPGAGKTTTAKVLHEVSGATHLWADHARREQFGKPTYSHAENIKLYDHLNSVAGDLLSGGKSVIFDTNFSFYEDREKLRSIANQAKARVIVVWVQTGKALAHKRATSDAHVQPTRVLGNMTDSDFERISNNIEEPCPDETVVAIDGTKVTPEYVKLRFDL